MTRINRIYGMGLVTGALCLFITGLFHPNVSHALSSAEATQAYIWTNTAVHSLAMFGAWLSLFGVVGFSRELGLTRPATVAGLTAYAIGIFLVCCAATLDGLVIPELLRRAQVVDEARRTALLSLIGFSGATASALADVYVAAVSLAVLFWAAPLYATRRAYRLVWSGIPIAILGLAGLATGLLKLNVHTLLLVVIVQGGWFAAAGVWLIKRNPEQT